MKNDPLIYKISVTMEKLSVSRATIYRLVSRGDLKLVKIGTASGITADSVRNFMDRLLEAA
ncbi:DNA binding domain-containing protein, excisionase family [Paraburkholderia fungorum]|uniref:DNA binding domain-containing protein, excisionase family n=1 Tax=Paraburkholderia fungorum TaxID=134537 RepID=A0A1H1IGX0_9BURK|nr:helix-turn-helix domain-containing protein [Paraburkholderia fungorum]SDR36995.1 DNA binding domain-containing protein, excisionase family [Paraburkholderia fungorum]